VTDKHMPRVTEDLINALISNGILLLSDLPADTQAKLTARTALRNKV